MTRLFTRYIHRSHSKKSHLVLSFLALALVQTTGCGGNGNGSGNSNTNNPTLYVKTVAGGGPNNSPASKVSLGIATSIGQDAAGNIYIASVTLNLVLRVGTDGNVNVVAGNGVAGCSGDGGQAVAAELNGPHGVSVDNSGNIFIADFYNNVIREVVATTGIIETVAGNGKAGYSGDGGQATQAELYGPVGVFVNNSDNIFIADSSNNVIREVMATPGIIETVAGNGKAGYSGDGGKATQAELNRPVGVFVNNSDDIFIVEAGNDRIREVVGSAGVIETVAGNGFLSYSGDGGLATQAQLYNPQGVSLDSSGNLFIADSSNNAIRQVAATTGIIETVAGNGKAGYSGDGGQATQAELQLPSGVFVDSAGNIFIADTQNVVIREVVAKTGIIETVAGNGTTGYSGDGGQATQAELGFPEGLFVDGSGNIFIAGGEIYYCYIDIDGVYQCIVAGGGNVRKVDTATGIIHAVAGGANPGYSGDGGKATQAELFNPTGVSVHPSGNIFIDDSVNNRIREVVGSTGVIQTVAGNGTSGFSGDGGPATQAELASPFGLVLDFAGNILFADSGSGRVRALVPR
jgi:trimeric autotransporter adhesin